MYALICTFITLLFCNMNSLVAMQQSPKQPDTLLQLAEQAISEPTEEKYFTKFVALCEQHYFSQRACDFLIQKEQELRPAPAEVLPDDEVYRSADATTEFQKSLIYDRVINMIYAIQGKISRLIQLPNKHIENNLK